MYYKIVIKSKGRLVKVLNGKTVRSPAVLFISEKDKKYIKKLCDVQNVDYVIEEITKEIYDKSIRETTDSTKILRKKRGTSSSINMSFTLQK